MPFIFLAFYFLTKVHSSWFLSTKNSHKNIWHNHPTGCSVTLGLPCVNGLWPARLKCINASYNVTLGKGDWLWKCNEKMQEAFNEIGPQQRNACISGPWEFKVNPTHPSTPENNRTNRTGPEIQTPDTFLSSQEGAQPSFLSQLEQSGFTQRQLSKVLPSAEHVEGRPLWDRSVQNRGKKGGVR